MPRISFPDASSSSHSPNKLGATKRMITRICINFCFRLQALTAIRRAFESDSQTDFDV